MRQANRTGDGQTTLLYVTCPRRCRSRTATVSFAQHRVGARLYMRTYVNHTLLVHILRTTATFVFCVGVVRMMGAHVGGAPRLSQPTNACMCLFALRSVSLLVRLCGLSVFVILFELCCLRGADCVCDWVCVCVCDGVSACLRLCL